MRELKTFAFECGLDQRVAQIDVRKANYASLHWVRSRGSANPVLALTRSNFKDRDGLAFGTPITETVSGNENILDTVDVRDIAYLNVTVTTPGDVDIELAVYLTDRE